jgi:polysaccharide biosynthesis/export protein
MIPGAESKSLKRLIIRTLLAVFLFCTSVSSAASQALTLSADLGHSGGGPTPHFNAIDDSYQAALQYQNVRYRLCASDVIAIRFPLTPEFNQTVTIQPDGFASLAGAESIHLENLTVDEAASTIRSAYAETLRDPIITIELKEFNRPYFIVSGEVNKPGKYDMRGYTSATTALAIAGGFSGAAARSRVLLFRRAGNDWYEVQPLNLKRLLRGRNMNEDAEVRPGDMLFVPRVSRPMIKRFIR